MGAGRKTQTFVLDTKKETSDDKPANRTASARHLRKADLGGVIFGCKNGTMRECLTKQLFGLPAAHYLYVKNIEPGLPLFLFNYTTRKLHGVYEAASGGQMYIDPYCWSEDGKERSPFPAQVRIRVRIQCQPLSENQFGEKISDNFYRPNHFWFELDHAQVEKLLLLFACGPVSAAMPQTLFPRSNHLNMVPINKSQSYRSLNASFSNPSNGDNNTEKSVWGNIVHAEDTHSTKSASDVPDDAWSPLLTDGNIAEIERGHSSGKGSCTGVDAERDIEKRESCLDKDDTGEEEALVLQKLKQIAVCRGVSNFLMKDMPGSDVVADSTEDVRQLDTDVLEVGHPVSPLQCDSPTKPDFQADIQVDNGKFDVGQPVFSRQSEFPALPDFQSDIQGMEKFWIMYKEQCQLTEALEKKLAEAKTTIQQLKTCVYELELKVDCQQKKPDESIHQFYHEPSEKLVYVLGGNDGASWLSSVDAYSPSTDIIRSLKPMISVRSYATAATLNGNLYVFGGGNGSSWYDSVECYRPESDDWIPCPSLMKKKGSLAGATAQNKLYAIGGGNGVETLSDVEMFDPILGRWISVQSLYEKRFAPAAAELNGVLYAVGGFDGKKYLQSTERFDPREPSWTRLQNMKVRRGCHSLAVLNDKLFALGGYDGAQMVSTVEIFEPRTCSWTMGDPMNFARGYGGAIILHDALYVIAGLGDVGGTLVDKVECYKEDQGWKVTNLKAVGKRSCFAIAIL